MTTERKNAMRKVKAYRIEMTDEIGKGWVGFVGARDEKDARGAALLAFDCEKITGVFGPFQVDVRMVANR